VLLEIGHIDKSHGLRGEVVVTLTTNVAGRLAPGSVLFRDPAGTGRLDVLSSQPHHHRWIVAFAGIDRREEADALRGAVLYGEQVEDGDPEPLWIHELIGAEVAETDGTARGRVVAVIDNPASDLLELDSGSLVPLRFVVEHDRGRGRVVVEVPLGLFDS
jgi:16S rRNA processing protein RimM